jgi:hypothetical protein
MDKAGVQIHKFADWLATQKKDGYSVAWLPLREEYTELINESEIWSWYDQVEGAKFDLSAYFFAFIDSPSYNYFAPFYKQFFLQFLSQYKEVISAGAYKWIIIDPFNRRLKALSKKQGKTFKEAKNLGEVISAAALLKTDLYELLAMPA